MNLSHLIFLLIALLLVACGGTAAPEASTKAESGAETGEQDVVEGLTAVVQRNIFDSAGVGTGGGGHETDGQPGFSNAAVALGVSENELRDALGQPPDFYAAAAALGVTVEALYETLGVSTQEP